MTDRVRLYWAGQEFLFLVDVLPPTLANFGTIVGSLNPVRSNLTGATNVTGTLASSLNAVTTALAGLSAQAVTGTQASSLSPVTAALLGVQVEGTAIAGVVQGQLSAVTAALAGDAIPGNTGTLAGELGPVSTELIGLALETPPTTEPELTGGGSLRRRFWTTTKTSGMISER